MKTELVFIPLPATGHVVSAVQLAKLLVERDEDLSVRILIFKLPIDTMANSYMQSLFDETTKGIQYVEVLDLEIQIDSAEKKPSQIPFTLLSSLIETQKAQVRNVVSQFNDSVSSRLAGFVVDTFCSSMIDVANEFEVPTYIFYASNASMLGFRHFIQSFVDENDDLSQYKDSEFEFSVATYTNSVPAKLCPAAIFSNLNDLITGQTRRLVTESKGIIVNTFLELESYAIQALARNEKVPAIYPVGPLLNLNGIGDKQENSDSILRWLDDQPISSVIFLCFGSFGSFEAEQVKEIAIAVEKSGCRFLWSLRRPPQKESQVEYPSEYENYEEVLPEGFLKRNSGTGKVIGWAHQVRVLGHKAVGGFMTHCGWNSVLESVWFGVPMATWPMYSEQQMNAFLLVKELGIAAEIKMDYKKGVLVNGSPLIVGADEIEGGIRKLMQPESKIRKRVKELKEKARDSIVEGGSSYITMGRLIEEFHGSHKGLYARDQ